MVHDHALAAHQDMQAAIAEPAADGGQLTQASRAPPHRPAGWLR